MRWLRALCCVCGFLGHLAPVPLCARSVCCVALRVRCPWPVGSCSPVCALGALRCVCGVLGHWAPVLRSARSVQRVARAVSWATWLLFTGVPARCVVLRVWCPGPLGSCSQVCPLGALGCVFGVLGHLAPVHLCAPSVRCVACAVSWATWLVFTGVPARCVVFCVWCPAPLGSCSPVCSLGALCCVCGVLGHLAPVHRCACWVRCVVCAVSWAILLLFTCVLAQCVVLRCVCGVLGPLAPVHRCARSVRCVPSRVACPGPLGSCSPVCSPAALCCVCGVLGHLAPVQRGARSVCCVACAVSSATWLLFTGVPARCVELHVRFPGSLGSCSPECSLGATCCVCGVLGHLDPVHRCARSLCCVACAVSWATWLLFTGVPARCVALRVQCPGTLGSCSPVCPLGLLCCVCGVLGHLAPVHRCAPSVRCVASAVSWATWLQFINALTRCVELPVRCPGPLGSCSLVCSLSVLCSMCGVLRHLAPVHRSVCSVPCVACVVSWAACLLFTNALAPCVVLCVRFPGPLGSCSPVCSLSVLCCVACAVSLASWLLFSGVRARCVALRVRCPGPLGSCSPECSLGATCCACGVLGHLAPVHGCARSVRCVARAVSWATWLVFTGVPARCVVLCVWCPALLGSCFPLCSLGALCCVCGVLGHLAPVHRCACWVRCVVCAVSWAILLLFTCVLAQCVVLRCVCGVLGLLAPVHRCARSVCCVPSRVACPGPLGSCSPVCSPTALCCLCGVLGHLAPVQRGARSVCCVACAVSSATWLLLTGVPAR